MTSAKQPEIVLIDDRIDGATLRRLVESHFEDTVKYVVDVERGITAVGGELDAEEEAFRCLLRFTPAASRQIPYL